MLFVQAMFGYAVGAAKSGRAASGKISQVSVLLHHTKNMPFQSQSATALRRLMTEYKQLTASGSPDGMFTTGWGSLVK